MFQCRGVLHIVRARAIHYNQIECHGFASNRQAIKAIVNAFQASPLPRAVVPAILGPRTKGNDLLSKTFKPYWSEAIGVQELVDNVIDAFALRR